MKKLKNVWVLFLAFAAIALCPIAAKAAEFQAVNETKEITQTDNTVTKTFQVTKAGTVTVNVAIEDVSTGTVQADVVVLLAGEKDLLSTDTSKLPIYQSGKAGASSLVDKTVSLEPGIYAVSVKLANLPADGTESGIKAKVQMTVAGDSTMFETDTKLEPMVPSVMDTLEDENISFNRVSFGETADELVYPIKFDSAGCVVLQVAEEDTAKEYTYLYMNMYSDKECTNNVGYSLSYNKGDITKSKEIEIPKAGTYYLKFELSREYGTKDTPSFLVSLPFVRSDDRTLAKGKIYLAYSGMDSKDTVYKIKVDKTGYINMAVAPLDNTQGGYIKCKLLNSKKKSITTEESVYTTRKSDGTYADAMQTYAVKKGTYYIKVSNSLGAQGVCWNFKEVKDKSGSSLKNATKLKLGSKTAAAGLCLVTDSKSTQDWFKFTLTKQQAVTVIIEAQVSGSARIEICDSAGKPLVFGTKTLQNGATKITLKSSGQWVKGTYTIKITKNGKAKNSIFYTVKVK